MSRAARLALLCLAGCLPLVPAWAGAADERLCSIKRVEQTASGINVYFVVRRQIMLMHEQEGDLYWIDAGARESEASGQKTLHALPLRPGEEAVVRNPDERCTLTLAQRKGKVGVDIEVFAWNNPKTAPKGTDKRGKFMPAQ